MVQAFISYSWDSASHAQWVRALADRLRNDGISPILDTTHVRPGEELPLFMEAGVRDSDFVLVICTEKYKWRADGRSGGVGYESSLLAAEALVFGNREKVIPILRGAEWPSSAPSFLLGMMYVDLREGPQADEAYARLLAMLQRSRGQTSAIARPLPIAQVPALSTSALAALRDAADAALRQVANRTSLDVSQELQILRGRIDDLEEELGRGANEGRRKLKGLLTELERLDLRFVRSSGIAMQNVERIRAEPDALLTLDFSEVHRYMHCFVDDEVAPYAIAALRTADRPLFLLPGTQLELRAYLERQRADYSDYDGMLHRLAEHSGRAPADLLLRRNGPLQRLERLFREGIVAPWPEELPYSKERAHAIFDLLRTGNTAGRFVDAVNLAMLTELRSHRPASHVTGASSLFLVADQIERGAESWLPLCIHPAQLALAKASAELSFPELSPDVLAVRELLALTPTIIRRWTRDLREEGLPHPRTPSLRDISAALLQARGVITAFAAWVGRQERADLFAETVPEPDRAPEFDEAYGEVVAVIERLLTFLDARGKTI